MLWAGSPAGGSPFRLGDRAEEVRPLLHAAESRKVARLRRAAQSTNWPRPVTSTRAAPRWTPERQLRPAPVLHQRAIGLQGLRFGSPLTHRVPAEARKQSVRPPTAAER